MAVCEICGREFYYLPPSLRVCKDCIVHRPEKALPLIERAHQDSRKAFNLPYGSFKDGILCGLCARKCRIKEGEQGFCGLRKVRNGRIEHLAGTPKKGLLSWYYDALPTNCVADWVCPGHNQYGLYNLAVFYKSCTLNCLFCQNWHFKTANLEKERFVSAKELAEAANSKVYCVCFFGGDPTSQMPHSLRAARLMAEKGIRICWETNGLFNPKFLEQAVKLSKATGGIIKFDLKTYTESLSIALTGFSNKKTLSNFKRAAEILGEGRKKHLVASSLMVPGYIDAEEVYLIAKFISRIDPEIPYSLLAFSPHFYFSNMPATSKKQTEECLSAARSAGLKNIKVGNLFLLK